MSNTCTFCNEEFGINAKLAVYKGYKYHPECFTCYNCKQTLADKEFFVDDEKGFNAKRPEMLCAECFRKTGPKCTKCNQPLEPQSQIAVFQGGKYHMECFQCSQCHKTMANQVYYSLGDQVYCKSCFEESNPGFIAGSSDLIGTACERCKQPFGEGERISAYKDKKYHFECFVCSECNKPVSGEGFYPMDDDRVLCLDCYAVFGPKCPACARTFNENEEVVEYDGKEYHKNCFKCEKCSKVIGDNAFRIDQGKVLCEDCK